MPLLRRASLCLPVLLVTLGTIPASGQKTFEVISVREHLSPGDPQSYGPTPDGYHMVNLPLALPILTAYLPSGSGTVFSMNNIVGIEDLMRMDRYDIDARVSEADRAAWQDPKQQPAMLREMLQALLADRFHLRVHREMKQQDIFLLQLARGGPKFQETKPDEPHPSTIALPGGGLVGPSTDNSYHFYDMPMSALAPFVSTVAGRTTQDDTGLSGHYDMSFPKPAYVGASDGGSDAAPSIFTVLAGLGLKLEPAKREVETLVIDHIEKPTAN
jgi:bla regulator protein blaR1